VISPEGERKGTVGSETKNVVSVFQVLQDSEETLIARGGNCTMCQYCLLSIIIST